MLQPLGHRVLIRPDSQQDGTESGLILPTDREYVPTAGTVVALGDGPARDARIRAVVIARCQSIVSELEELHPHGRELAMAIRDELRRYGNRPARVDSVRVGDHVAFPDEVGSAITWEGERLLILPEDDLVVVEPEEVTA